MNANEYPINQNSNTNYSDTIRLNLNNWDIEDVTYNQFRASHGPRWNVRIAFHGITSTEQAIAKRNELEADCKAQGLEVDYAGVRTYVEGDPIHARLVILEPGSKSAYAK